MMASKVKLEVHHVRFFEYQPLPINCIAHDPSSSRVAVSRSDGSVQILSTTDNWAQELSFPGADSSVEALVWCQQRLFAAGLSGNVVELDLDTQLLKESVSSNSGPVWCLAGNEEESQLAAGTEDGCVVLFSIEDELQFLRLFGKQEGRILTIAWFHSSVENIIVTGGANNIRQWSVNSGQPISRMSVATNNNKETIVWCVVVTGDFTIISGDSRGVITFWNGKLSTQIKSFHCHKADVLSLCLSQDETTVYSGGVDAAVYRFTHYRPDPSSERMRWAHQLLHSYHSHDVRALAFVNGCLASGGVDTIMQVARLQEDAKQVRPVTPFPAGVLVDVDREHKLVMLQYKNFLELWRLGAAEAPDEEMVQGIIPLSQNPLKLIQLKARPGQEVACSALSSDGQVAFSDLQQVRIYRFDVTEVEASSPKLSLERVKHSFSNPARLITFSASGEYLVAVPVGSSLEVMNTRSGNILHKLKTDSIIHILKASPDSDVIAYATVNHKVYVTDLPSGKVLFQCPVMSSHVSALSFSPHRPSLFIAYCNHKIYEMDIAKKEYSSWCRENSQDFPKNWLQSFRTIRDIVFQPNNPDLVYMYTDSSLAVMDVRNMEKGQLADKAMGQTVRKCFKYKYMLHADFLHDGSLVVIERPPAMLDEQLPPSLKQKKFGVA